jgi:hypothetical protein
MKYRHDYGNFHLDDVNKLKFVVGYSPNWIYASWVVALETVSQENIVSFGFLLS